jgi:hypothetical protein
MGIGHIFNIPNAIDSWNLLDVDMQNQHSRLMFKKQIRSNVSVNITQTYITHNYIWSIVYQVI